MARTLRKKDLAGVQVHESLKDALRWVAEESERFHLKMHAKLLKQKADKHVRKP